MFLMNKRSLQHLLQNITAICHSPGQKIKVLNRNVFQSLRKSPYKIYIQKFTVNLKVPGP